MNYLALIISILIAEAAGLLGSIFTFRSIPTWYATLKKPSFNPPSWLFGPVWTILYIFMGISSYMIWQRRGVADVKLALIVYGIQLALNALWSILFFGLKNPGLALVEIVFLWIAILATIILFWPINAYAGALLIPYLAWVTFASFLNYNIWVLNR